MNDRSLRRQQIGSAGLPMTIVLWCLSAGGVATFVAPSFDADTRNEVVAPLGHALLAPVTEVTALDDRRGLRRSLNELLPDYRVGAEISEVEASSESVLAREEVVEIEVQTAGSVHHPIPQLTARVSIKAPALTVAEGRSAITEAAELTVSAEPVAEGVEALVKSVGQPAAAPAYVAVQPVTTPVSAPRLDWSLPEPKAQVSIPGQAVAEESVSEAVVEPSPSASLARPERAPATRAAPVCASAPTCLAQQHRGRGPVDLVALEAAPGRAPSVAPLIAQTAARESDDLLELVTQRLREGDHAGAYQMFRQQIRAGRAISGSGRSLELYAISALGAGAYREAAISYERLIDSEPLASKWWLGLAASRQAIGLDSSELFARAAVLAQPSSLVAQR